LYLTGTFAEAATLAEPFALKAVTLDSSDPEAYAVLALVSAARGDLATELARADQALSLDPNCALALRIKGACLVCSPTTRADGCQSLLKSLRLNPKDPRNWWIWNSLAMGRYLLDDYNGAFEAATLAIRTRRGRAGLGAYRWLIAALGQLERTAEACEVVRQAADALAPVSFDVHAAQHMPWIRDDDYAHLLDGLHKAGWKPVQETTSAEVL
jgi:adenylate cyclase